MEQLEVKILTAFNVCFLSIIIKAGITYLLNKIFNQKGGFFVKKKNINE